MKISKNISMTEATKSNTATRHGISNLPTEEHLVNMKLVANHVFQPLREHFGVEIGISSFYRSAELNEKIGGAKASQHLTGHAMDIDADMFNKKVVVDGEVTLLTNKMIFDWIVENVDFDTIIWEFGDNDNAAWIHVSYVQGSNRRRKLKAFKDNNKKTQYSFYA
jgi:zinc D-Ala-D-Ala carboxypeptidase